ncbi:MAG: A/G-specific adenine glycosylase [Alphaproteobacteria bacterium]|nr:A/G-specific adenine glycosylase [Alphaproteobacteria bacterium]
MDSHSDIQIGVRDILAWYDRNRRAMPWRALPGETADPYHVWLSEIMLQQTTVATVGPYFQRFIERWPDVVALADAPLDDVLHAWQGLGYYARARNLHRCAGVVATDFGGRFPDSEAVLLELPGVGRYTAAAVAAIAFDRRATVVDGNVERVMARRFRVTESLPGCKPQLYMLADSLTPDTRPGDYAQAVMDLGATICTPRSPRCLLCPWSNCCAGRDIAAELPARAPKKARPLRRGVAFWLTRADGAVLLRRRQEKGLLGGMMETPSTDWREGPVVSQAQAEAEAPLPAHAWRMLPGMVEHGFTHFRLELQILAGQATGDPQPPARWCSIESLTDEALPTLMKKVVAHARSAT